MFFNIILSIISLYWVIKRSCTSKDARTKIKAIDEFHHLKSVLALSDLSQKFAGEDIVVAVNAILLHDYNRF